MSKKSNIKNSIAYAVLWMFVFMPMCIVHANKPQETIKIPHLYDFLNSDVIPAWVLRGEPIMIINVADMHLDDLLANIIKTKLDAPVREEISESLIRCYHMLLRGEEDLFVDDLLAIMPDIATYAAQCELAKAPRPDAPNPFSEPSGIAGPGTCDVSGILAALGGVRSAIIQCCNQIQQDFINTWTILADIKDTLTACCTSIHEDFADTWTILADIKDTITACCTSIHEDFADTWTILADIKDTLTACCTNIQNNFEGTFTVLGEMVTTLTFQGNQYYPRLGTDGTNRLDIINPDLQSLTEWLKVNYSLILSLHNYLIGTQGGDTCAPGIYITPVEIT